MNAGEHSVFKRLSRICFVFVAVLAASAPASMPASAMAECGGEKMAAPAMDAAQVEAWSGDLAVFHKELELRHIDLYHGIDRNSFAADLAAIKGALPSMNEDEAIVALMRLTRRVGDGHTSVPLWNGAQCRFPVEFRMIEGSAYVTGASGAQAHLLGSKLISINGHSASKVIGDLSSVVAFAENPYSTALRTGQQLPNAEILSGLGIVDPTGMSTFAFESQNKRVVVRLSPSTEDGATTRLSLGNKHFADRIEGDDRLWFASEDNGRSVYVGFRRYPAQAAMAVFAQKLLEYINKNDTKNLIIDLRANSGGDFFTGLMLAQRLVLADGLDWKSGIFVLTDNETFSAAMSNAAQFSQLLNAKRIGQPTGGKPSGYQDMGEFSLPGSGLTITYSKRLYHFDGRELDTLRPDILVEVTIDDYLNGHDPALERVLVELPKPGALN